MNLPPIPFGILIVMALASAVAGCGKGKQTSLEITPREVRSAELIYAVSELPAGFREGLSGSEPEMAKQLGLQVWAFDFKGGPFGCWIDIEEKGQQTAISPFPRSATARIGCEGEEGVLLFWFLPRTTPQMPQHLKDRFLSNTPKVPNLFIALDCNGKKTLDMSQYDNPDKPIVPLWFGWKEAEARTQAHTAVLEPEKLATILMIEATEREAAGSPKKVKLSLTVVK
jgi:hypothetical protein